jgi:hypothetical protein
MKKTQSIDGIILGPQHACHMSHKPGINRRLKAEASHSVRQAYKHEITSQLEEMDEEIAFQHHMDRIDAHEELYDDRENECIETFASVVQLIFRLLDYRGLSLADIEFVTDGGAWCTWDEFVAMYTGSIYPPALNVKLVGNGWFYDQRSNSDGDMCWCFHRMPVKPEYHSPLAFMPDIRVQ